MIEILDSWSGGLLRTVEGNMTPAPNCIEFEITPTDEEKTDSGIILASVGEGVGTLFSSVNKGTISKMPEDKEYVYINDKQEPITENPHKEFTVGDNCFWKRNSQALCYRIEDKYYMLVHIKNIFPVKYTC